MQSYIMPLGSRIDRRIEKPHFFKWSGMIGAWLDEQIKAQKEHSFLWWPVIFSFGIGAYFSLPFEPPLLLSLLLCMILLAIRYLLSDKLGETARKVFLFVFIFFLGFVASNIRTYMIDAPIIVEPINFTIIEGRVLSLDILEEGGGSRIILGDLWIEDIPDQETPEKVRLRLRKDDGVQVGQVVRVKAMLNPPSLPLYPGGFDFRRYLYFQGIGAVGFIYKPPEVIKDTHESLWDIQALRQTIAKRLFDVMPERQASIAVALIVGQKNAISDADRKAVRDAGLAHMLAISGLHVGLLSGCVFFFIRGLLACIPALALRFSIKNIAAICAFLTALFYMILAGATIPTQRAVMMCGIVFLAVILNRSPISLRLVAFSALVVLAFSPESLMSASFQMSFAAVTCLIYFYDKTRKFWIDQYAQGGLFRKLVLYFVGVCLTTLIASFATAPFSLYHFGQVSFLGSLANLVAVPLLAFIVMPFAFLSVLLMPFNLEWGSSFIMGMGIKGILDIAEWAASLPMAVLITSSWDFKWFVILVFCTLWFMLWKGAGKFLALPLFMIACFGLSSRVLPDILITDSHKLFGFRVDRSLYVTSFRTDRFARENWERYYGIEKGLAKKVTFKGSEKQKGIIQCGEAGCRYSLKGFKISFVRSPYFLKDECAWADILLSVNPVRKKDDCNAAVVIGKFDTWARGGYSITIKENRPLLVDYVIHEDELRPWHGLK